MEKKEKTHGNAGNKNACKEIKKDRYIYLRVTQNLKNAMVRQAQYDELKLSAWIEKTCLSALSKEIKDKFGVNQ